MIRICTRRKVTDKIWSYHCLDKVRIGFSPDRRIIHLPFCKFCLFIGKLKPFTNFVPLNHNQ